MYTTVGDPSQASLVNGDPVLAGSVLAVQDMVMFGGHVIPGASISSIAISCTQVLLLPQRSVAMNFL
jgi:hypothetical protein